MKKRKKEKRNRKRTLAEGERNSSISEEQRVE
jgi:hypothetical protein